MERQGSLFSQKTLRNLSRQFDTPANVLAGAQGYQAAQGKRFSTAGLGNVQRSHQHGYATALAYQRAQGQPEQPGIRASYEAMRQHVNKQYEYMTRPKEQGGMGMTHTVTPHDPYEMNWASGGSDVDAARAMVADIAKGHIKTWTSAGTPHNFFTEQENDRFRAVHDVFGHAATGRGFSRHGEEAAYAAHSQMFPSSAHAALASETRGQNSYLNYGGGEFPEQSSKLIGLPAWAGSRSQQLRPAPDRPVLASRQMKFAGM